MVEAGRVLTRKTVVKHSKSGLVVTVDNKHIPTNAPHRSHMQQRDVALVELSKKLGEPVKLSHCAFDYSVG